MTLTIRIATCQKLIEQLQAEKIGLLQALIGPNTHSIPPDAFETEHERHGFFSGLEEGRAILEKGEGV